MLNEDVNHTLHNEINRHLDERFSSLREEINRLPQQFSEALNEVKEQLAQVAERHEQAVASWQRAASAAALPTALSPAASPLDVSVMRHEISALKHAIDDLDARRSQSEILEALVNRAASFAPQVVFFVIKNEMATGWRARSTTHAALSDAQVRELTIPLAAKTILREAVNSNDSVNDNEERADDFLIYAKLGTTMTTTTTTTRPRAMVAVPLVVRNRAVAVLYADSAAHHDDGADAINLPALEAVVRVAAMAVELLATQRPTAAQQRVVPAPPPYVAPPRQMSAAKDLPATSEAVNAALTAQLQDGEATFSGGGSQEAGEIPSAVADDAYMTEVAQPDFGNAVEASSNFSLPADYDASFARQDSTVKDSSVADDSVKENVFAKENVVAAAPPSDETANHHASANFDFKIEPPTAIPVSPVVAASSSFVAPLGSTTTLTRNSYGKELPVEVADERDQKLHTDARRYARLLVSEIKLYNEEKVREGRAEGNLYERLREPIDRSREMYDKRVAPPVAARYDYFHHELIQMLAEGDARKLGAAYEAVGV